MLRLQALIRDTVLGVVPQQRLRTSQTLLATPPLLLIQLLLGLQWQQGYLEGHVLATYVTLTASGCVVFYLLARLGLGERLSAEPSLSAPQMGYAMLCTAWAYPLAGPLRSALLPLLPLILCFGIFALRARAARALSNVGIALMGAVMAWLTTSDPSGHPPMVEAAHFAVLATAMAMIRVLADRLSRLRARLSAQRAELAQALERIQELATRDTLTGLFNRRAAHEVLGTAAHLAQRQGRPLTVGLADLDHFKQVNDSFGHQVGDRVLQLFARTAENELRGADVVARWGGEEFLFVLPDTDEAQACVCLDRLRSAYGAGDVDGYASTRRLSFSAGVSRCAGPSDIDAAIERADRALYAAKQVGRAQTRASGAAAGAPAGATQPASRAAAPAVDPAVDPAIDPQTAGS